MVLDKITAEVVLLVEGADDQQIVAALLDQLKPGWKSLIDIQAKAQNGGLVQGARALAVVSGFDRVKTVAVLVDADETPEKTNARWAAETQSFLQKHPALQMRYLVLPSADLKGALETVFLQSLSVENEKFQCVKQLMVCLSGITRHTTQSQKDKLALITYINACVKTPYARVGKALEQAARGLFDFKHPAFIPLVVFLESLTHV